MDAFRRGNTVYLHTRKPLISTGLAIPACTQLPAKVTLLNTRQPVDFCIETYPEDYKWSFGESKPPVLHLRHIPTEENGMPLVLRLDFDGEI